MDDLAGKAVLMTGGSSGIGYAMAAALLNAGARVAIISRRDPSDWRMPLPAHWNAKTDLIRADLANECSILSALGPWLDLNGSALDALITSAVDYASPSRHVLAETSLAEWDKLFAVNARGTFL